MPSSGTGGPCSHCFRTQSCCWRRGPASKPILCNACGSRYLVKKSLDGYIPIQQRPVLSARLPPQAKARSKRRSATPPNGAGRAKRNLVKTVDALWQSGEDESDDSDAACPAGDSAAAPISRSYLGNGAVAHALHPGRPLLAAGMRTGNVVHITMEAELREFGPDVLFQLLPSMRMKPRKPVNPRVSVVF